MLLWQKTQSPWINVDKPRCVSRFHNWAHSKVGCSVKHFYSMWMFFKRKILPPSKPQTLPEAQGQPIDQDAGSPAQNQPNRAKFPRFSRRKRDRQQQHSISSQETITTMDQQHPQPMDVVQDRVNGTHRENEENENGSVNGEWEIFLEKWLLDGDVLSRKPRRSAGFHGHLGDCPGRCVTRAGVVASHVPEHGRCHRDGSAYHGQCGAVGWG